MDKQVKKDPKLSVKINGIERSLKKSESFPWILPEKTDEQENVIVLDEKRKKKKSIPKVKEEMNEMIQQNKKKRRKREGVLFALFAVIIGVGFGFGLLKMIQSSPEQAASSMEGVANPKEVSTTLEALEVYVLQSGVFTDATGAEKLEKQLLSEGAPASVIEKDKAYVISGIAGSEESLNKIKGNGTTYKKTFAIPAMDMMSSSEQESEKIILIRNIIEKMIQAGESTSEKEWAELGKQVEALKKMESAEKDKELYEVTLAAYKVVTSQNGKVDTETQQALLNCFANYQKYVLEATK